MESAKKKKRVPLGVDLDDILLSFSHGFLAYNRKKYGLDMKRQDLFDFDYEKTFPLPLTETVRRLFEFHRSPEHDLTPPIRGAIEGLTTLKNKYDIHVITSRADTLRESVERWLSKHFNGLIDSIYFTDQYYGDETKKI